ncbi:Rsph1, partial [Symbiodinium necroappetens]
ARKITPPASSPRPPPVHPDRAMAGYDKVPAEWSRPTTWPPRKSLPERRPDAPHVVLSTKFGEPWYSISIGIKEILEELGCTVYNPNTDNKALTVSKHLSRVSELYKDKADDRWLRTFTENLDRILERKSGFVLQIQQGMAQEKSDMQVAEERMGKMWAVPRMGIYAFPTRSATYTRGGNTLAEQYLALAVERAQKQWEEERIKDEVEMVSEWFEPLEGDRELRVDDRGHLQGRARCTYPSGNVYEGEFQDGRRHGKGTFTYKSGAVYEGQWKDGQQHGKGTFTSASGNVEVGFYDKDERKGRGVKLSADRRQAWLLMDGKKEREVSVAEAGGPPNQRKG